MAQGRPKSAETIRKEEALRLLERYERGELVEVEKTTSEKATDDMSAVAEHFAVDKFRTVMQEEGKKLLRKFEKESEAIERRLLEARSKEIVIKSPHTEVTLPNMVHYKFDTLVKMLSVGIPVMLVGPAGSVKTSSCALAAKAMGLDYSIQSVSSQTSESKLIGYATAHGEYHETAFYRRYKHGGLFVLDEVDAGNANVLVILNNAISGDRALFDNEMVDKHPDFRFVATANTYGHGANREFVGRNQLDSATLDRFAVLDWPIDTTLEWSFVDTYKHGDKWYAVVQEIRKHVYNSGVLMQVSPRMTIRGAQMLELGIPLDVVVEVCVVAPAPEQQKSFLRTFAKNAAIHQGLK